MCQRLLAADALERLRPGLDLLVHGTEGLGGTVGRGELGHGGEVVAEGEEHLGADIGHLQLSGDETPGLDGAGAAGGAVGDEADGLVVPLGVEVVDGVS